MWLFAAISVAIATPCVRSWLEALFAELSIVFFTYLTLVSIALSLVLLLALVFQSRRFLYRRPNLTIKTCTASLSNAFVAKKKAIGHVQWKRGTKRHALLLRVKSTTSEIAGSGFYPPQLWTLALVVLTVLPIINSVMVGGGGEREEKKASNFHSRFKRETAAVAVATEAAALVALQQQLTTCRSSEGDSCLDNVTTIAELGEYRQAAGYCVAFDAAYVDVAQAETTMLAQYFPIGVHEAYEHGYGNNFSAWSDMNQETFQTDCSLLYNETVKGEAQELLCCTETQYEMLSSRLQQLPGQCASCKENVCNLWCQFTCHPSNSLFVDVTQVRLLEGDADHAHEVFPVIEEATYYVGRDVVSDLHGFCEADGEFAPLVCGTNKENCSTTGFDMLEYLSAHSFHSAGSSSQVHFTTVERLTAAEQQQTICACGNTNATGCFAPMNTRLESCADTCGALCAVDVDDRRQYESVCYNSSSSLVLNDLSVPTFNSTLATGDSSATSQIGSLLSELSSRVEDGDVIVLNYVLAVLASFWLTALALGFAYSARYSKKKRESVLTNPVNGSRGRGMMLPLTDVDRLQGISRWDDWLTQHLKRWGDFVAMGNHPLYIILLSLMVVMCCSSGLARLEVESESMKLWVSEGSTVFQEKARFEKMLGPLDRVERLVLVAKDGGAVTRSAYLKEAIRLQLIIANEVTSGSSTLSDICLKDVLTSSSCQVHAVTQYFQNNMEHFKVYETYGLVDKHLSNCAKSPERADSDVCSELQAQINASSGTSLPASMNDCPCVSSFGAPMLELEKYLGGITATGDSLDANTLLQQGSSLLSTVAVVNHHDTAKNSNAIAWERAFLTRMKKEAEANTLYDAHYAAETSADDEFAHALDLGVVCKAGFAGFVFMFVYVIVGLNRWKLDRSFFYSSKIGVGMMGVACILMSVGGTLGLIAWTGVKLQVVTLVVLPLVVLAISTGNIFLILHAVDLKQDELKMEQQSLFVGLEDNDFGVHEITCVLLCEATGHIGPSMIVTNACECCILAVAVYSVMPAAQWLAGSLVVGIAASLALQMTLFLAIVAFDKRRELSGTYDVICCKRASFARRSHLSDGTTATTENSSFSGSSFSLPTWNLMDHCVTGYLKILTTKVSKVFVLLIFVVFTLLAIASIETMESGLLPTSFIPSSSYLHAYHRALDESNLSSEEFPVYFVVEAGYGRNPDGYSLVNDAETQRRLCTSREVCANLSIPNILSALVKEGASNVTSFKDGVAVGSWLDDFWGFIDPHSECCRIDPENSPLRQDESTAEYVRERVTSTSSCLADASEVVSVPRESFVPLVWMFYTTASGPLCPYAAGSRYRGQLSIDRRAIPAMSSNATSTLSGTGYGNEVTAFAYEVMSTTVSSSSTGSSSQEGAIKAYSQARHIAKWISEQTDIDVWVYSPEYVFLDQFHSVRRMAYILLGIGLAAVFMLQSAALGSCGYGLAVTFIAAATVVQVAGLMTSMGVFLNSLSIVNLAIAVAFSVGFSGHFARLFAKARSLTDSFGNPLAGDVCVKKVMTQLLTSWMLGVAVSKFVAIAALALVATSAGNCFFRTLVAATVCAWLNNALLLPVVLSISVDATAGRVREVKSTTEEGDEYSCSSPSSSYHDASVVGFY